MEEKDRAVVTQPPSYSEAPASFNFPVYIKNKDGVEVAFGLTVRGNSGPEAIENLLSTLAYGQKRCGMALIKTLNPSPAETRQAAAQAAGPSPELDRLPPAPSQAPQEPRSNPVSTGVAPGTPNTIYAIRLEILPKPGGKVSLNWYAEGHRMATIYATLPIDRACDLLQSSGEQWKAADLTRADDVKVRHAILWVEGKVNPNSPEGRHFRNIVAINTY